MRVFTKKPKLLKSRPTVIETKPKVQNWLELPNGLTWQLSSCFLIVFWRKTPKNTKNVTPSDKWYKCDVFTVFWMSHCDITCHVFRYPWYVHNDNLCTCQPNHQKSRTPPLKSDREPFWSRLLNIEEKAVECTKEKGCVQGPIDVYFSPTFSFYSPSLSSPIFILFNSAF